MIVTPDDIEQYRAVLERYERDTKWMLLSDRFIEERGIDDPKTWAKAVVDGLAPEELLAMGTARGDRLDMLRHLRQNPQLLVPLGFDEIRIDPEPAGRLAAALSQEFEARFPDASEATGFDGATPSRFRDEGLEFLLGVACRDATSGLWYTKARFSFSHQQVEFRAKTGDTKLVSLREILARCEHATADAGHPAVLMLPRLWVPPEEQHAIELADATRAVVLALQREAIGFNQLTWQQLESIVAEVLRDRGLEVVVTPRAADGGRDIIARGELFEGEPMVLAVEVKHKGVVGVDDVRSRLYANREFPALLFATSGRFTAGVVQEKLRPENFMRLLLKDGQALSSWIRDYGVQD